MSFKEYALSFAIAIPVMCVAVYAVLCFMEMVARQVVA